jgi:membrane protease YdiL (CAAX protease family)
MAEVITAALPPDGVVYPQVLRGPGYVWWRSLFGVAFGLSFFVVLTQVVQQAVVAVSWALFPAGLNYRTYFTSAFAFQRPTGMLAVNLGLATLIPIAAGLMVLVHHMRPGWLASVQAGVRWRYLLACLGVAAVILAAVPLVSALVGPPTHIAPQPGVWTFLVVILLTSPLQAAAEEVFFRGYLLQALGSLFAQPWVGLVLSSVVFAFLHGTQNLPLFLDRLVFGLLAAGLVWRTGGLEAGIAAHVVNNVFAYGIAAFTTSIAALKAVAGIDWLNAAFDVGGFALFAVGALLVARWMHPATRVDLAALGHTVRRPS